MRTLLVGRQLGTVGGVCQLDTGWGRSTDPPTNTQLPPSPDALQIRWGCRCVDASTGRRVEQAREGPSLDPAALPLAVSSGSGAPWSVPGATKPPLILLKTDSHQPSSSPKPPCLLARRDRGGTRRSQKQRGTGLKEGNPDPDRARPD